MYIIYVIPPSIVTQKLRTTEIFIAEEWLYSGWIRYRGFSSPDERAVECPFDDTRLSFSSLLFSNILWNTCTSSASCHFAGCYSFCLLMIEMQCPYTSKGLCIRALWCCTVQSYSRWVWSRIVQISVVEDCVARFGNSSQLHEQLWPLILPSTNTVQEAQRGRRVT